MKRLFLRARLQAIWYLLTKPWFVCITADDDGNAKGRLNVNHASFCLLVQVMEPVHESNEAGASLLHDAKELLKPKN